EKTRPPPSTRRRRGPGAQGKDGRIEIQGDQWERIVAELEKLGYKVKRFGVERGSLMVPLESLRRRCGPPALAEQVCGLLLQAREEPELHQRGGLASCRSSSSNAS